MDTPSQQEIPETLGIIAGRGSYPWQLARSAHAQGVKRVVAFAFRHETSLLVQHYADETRWLWLGQLQALLDAIQAAGVTQVVMAGQIKPTRLFSLRLDRLALSALRALPERNAHTIFGAIADLLQGVGATLLPASSFMETEMPSAGLLSSRPPTDRELADLRLGALVAKTTSGLDIGQTVVVKEGTVLAVEDFGGTANAASYAKYLKRMMDEVPGLRFALDSGNLYYAGRGDDILELMEHVKTRVAHVHLKDQTPEDNRKYTTLGLGAVPNEKIVKAMNAAGYDGWYTLENPVGDVYSDTVRQVALLKSWLAESAPAAR